MVLVVTPGASNADSYATLAACDAYHAALGRATWSGSDPLKEQALRRATLWLDGVYRRRWSGERSYRRNQSREWPRSNAYDIQDNVLDPITIPPEVVNATCEAALRELVKPGSLSPDVVPGQMKVLTGVKGINWTPLRQSASVNDMAPTLLAVSNALSGIIRTGGGSVEIVRA